MATAPTSDEDPCPGVAAANERTLTSYINRALRRHDEAVEAPDAYAQKVAEVLAPTIAPKKKPAKERA